MTDSVAALIYEVAELKRRMGQLIQYGTIESVSGTSARVRIGELLSAPLPWLTLRASDDITWWQPRVAEQVVILSPFGDLAQGVILPSLYRSSFNPPVVDSELFTATIGECMIEISREGRVVMSTPLEATLASEKVVVDSLKTQVDAMEKIDLNSPEVNLNGFTSVQVATPLLSISAIAVEIAAQTMSFASPQFTMDVSDSGVSISSPEPLTLDVPELNVTGDVTAGDISLLDHRHADVEPGAGETGEAV